MANDRLYLQCPKCNVEVFLCKHLEQGWYRKDKKAVGDVLEQFLEDHFWCRQDGGQAAAVELWSEMDNDYKQRPGE